MHERDVWMGCMHVWRGCIHAWRGCIPTRRGCIKKMCACREGLHSYCQQVWGQAGIAGRALGEDSSSSSTSSSNPVCVSGLKGRKIWQRACRHLPELGGGGRDLPRSSARTGPGGAGRGTGMVLGVAQHSTHPAWHSTNPAWREERRDGGKQGGRKDRRTDSTAPCSYRDGASDDPSRPSSIPFLGFKSHP